MLFTPPGINEYAFGTYSWGTTRPAAANGTAVTPNNLTAAYGTTAQLFTALTYDAYGIFININSNAASGASRNTVVRIGIDEAGGTNYTGVINDLLCGGAPAYTVGSGGIYYYFPLFIPAGSTVGAAARGSVGTAFRVGAVLQQQPLNPTLCSRGTFVETLGITLGTAIARGVTVTPGTTAEGTPWTLIGTTTRRCWYWEYGIQMATTDTAWGANVLYTDIGIGDGSLGGTTPIITDMWSSTDATENFSKINTAGFAEYDVPAGTNVYARMQNSGTNDAYQIAVYGMGG